MSALLHSTSSPPPGIQTRLFLPSPHSLFRSDEQEREMHAATVEVDRGWPRRSGELAEKGRTDGLIIGDQNGLSLGRLGTHKFISFSFRSLT